jgi:hypothetical protein
MEGSNFGGIIIGEGRRQQFFEFITPHSSFLAARHCYGCKI